MKKHPSFYNIRFNNWFIFQHKKVLLVLQDEEKNLRKLRRISRKILKNRFASNWLKGFIREHILSAIIWELQGIEGTRHMHKEIIFNHRERTKIPF